MASPREQCASLVGYRKLNKGSAIGGLATNTEVVNEDKPWLPKKLNLQNISSQVSLMVHS